MKPLCKPVNSYEMSAQLFHRNFHSNFTVSARQSRFMKLLRTAVRSYDIMHSCFIVVFQLVSQQVLSSE